jgi:hypothetical protein
MIRRSLAQCQTAVRSPPENSIADRIFCKCRSQLPGMFFVAAADKLSYLIKINDLPEMRVWCCSCKHFVGAER